MTQAQINLLNLQSSLLIVPKSSPAAKNRYLHIPGTEGLTIIPQSFSTLLKSPLTKILIPAILGGIFRSHSPALKALREDDDVSVDAFITAKFGEDFARLFASALIHGIYAADSRQLSMRASFPSLWNASRCGGRRSMQKDDPRSRHPYPSHDHHRPHRRWGFKCHDIGPEEDYNLGGMRGIMKGVSVYSFKEGMETIVRTVEDSLQKNSRISILKDTTVESIAKDPSSEDFIVGLSLLRPRDGLTVFRIDTGEYLLWRSDQGLTHRVGNASTQTPNHH